MSKNSIFKVSVDNVGDEEFNQLEPELGALVNHDGVLKKGTGSAWETIGSGGGSSVTTYAARIAWVSGEPTATVLQNGFSEEIVWSKESTGLISGVLSGAFTSGKTFLSVTQGGSFTGGPKYLEFGTAGASQVNLRSYTRSANAAADFGGSEIFVEIRVYP